MNFPNFSSTPSPSKCFSKSYSPSPYFRKLCCLPRPPLPTISSLSNSHRTYGPLRCCRYLSNYRIIFPFRHYFPLFHLGNRLLRRANNCSFWPFIMHRMHFLTIVFLANLVIKKKIKYRILIFLLNIIFPFFIIFVINNNW